MASEKRRKKAASPATAAPLRGPPKAERFPIVGLGASAGGLGALEEFFTHLPARTGIAFVVVTHLHPGQPSLLAEILGRKTAMPVVQVSAATRVERDHVYTAEPGADLAIIQGVLHPMTVDAKKPPHLPIDHFFRSLARDQKELAIAIVLSGTGSDGTLGIKEIKGELGMVMVQEEASAEYGGMPHSAIATQLVDFVLPVTRMPDQLIAFAESLAPDRGTRLAGVEPPLEALHRIFLMMRNRTGHDFSHYKVSTVGRRIERRMHVHRLESIEQYVRYLGTNPGEVDLLFKELLIGVTSFFRDREAWEALTPLVTQLLGGRPDDYVVRAWVPGCSTGEEAYGLAMLLREAMDVIGRRLAVQIFATDLDAESIAAARAGSYPVGIANDVPAKRLARFFMHEGESYRVKKELREMIVFAPQNLITDPPFTKLDILSCRNLLIYLDATLQGKLLPLFHYALRPGGLLFLGPSESTGASSELFITVDKKWKIFRRQEVPAHTYVAEFPLTAPELAAMSVPGAAGHGGWRGSVEQLAERMLLRELVAPSAIVNERGDVLYLHGRTGKFLEPAPGSQATANLFNMAREGLEISLSTAIRQAAASGEEVVMRGVRVRTNGDVAHVDLRVRRVASPEPLRGLFRVTFEEVPPAQREQPGATSRVDQPDGLSQLEEELQHAREVHQATIEELETSNEELKSTNEELQSTNEELQSANEELGTSREEMQSLNEELQTVNTELQNKLEQLAHANDDMKNLLDATDIATVFVDAELRINRYTERARAVFRLIPSDVGRPLGDLATTLHYESLIDDAREVLRTLAFKEKEVRAEGGARYLMRILPYRTTENVIEGLVLTFVDVTKIETLRAEQARLLEALSRSPVEVYGQDDGLRISWACETVFGRRREEVIGKTDAALFDAGDAEAVIEAKQRVLATGVPASRRASPRVHGERRAYELFMAPTRDESGRIIGVSCVAVDIDQHARGAS